MLRKSGKIMVAGAKLLLSVAAPELRAKLSDKLSGIRIATSAHSSRKLAKIPRAALALIAAPSKETRVANGKYLANRHREALDTHSYLSHERYRALRDRKLIRGARVYKPCAHRAAKRQRKRPQHSRHARKLQKSQKP